MDFRGNLEVGRSEDSPEAETHGEPMRTPGGDEDFKTEVQEERRWRVSRAGEDIEVIVAT